MIIKIIPYLVGIIVGIRVFRDSGALDAIIQGISWIFLHIGINSEFVPSLPVAIMRPFSGGGGRGPGGDGGAGSGSGGGGSGSGGGGSGDDGSGSDGGDGGMNASMCVCVCVGW